MANLEEEVFESPDYIDDAKDENNDNYDNNNDDDDDMLDDEKKEKETERNVIEEQIVPSMAFQIYAGNLYDPSQSSQSSSKNTRKIERVYDSTNVSDAKYESPLQTYKRLQYEMDEFKEKLKSLTKQATDDEQDPSKQIATELSKQLGDLWSNVEGFKKNPQIASLFNEANSALLDTVDANHLFKRLQDFQAQKMNDRTDDSSNNESTAVFTLYHDGSMNTQNYRMAEIFERLSKLEKIIGPKPDNATIGDMTQSVEYLSSVLSLLSDDNKLEQLKRKANTLRKKLQEIQAKGHAAIELQITKTKEDKITKMFEMMTRWDEAAEQLPTIVDRMRSISNLHEESANIVEKVDRLDTQNKLIEQSLKSNENILNNVQKSLASNAKTMQDNMEMIDKRLKQIQEKLKN